MPGSRLRRLGPYKALPPFANPAKAGSADMKR